MTGAGIGGARGSSAPAARSPAAWPPGDPRRLLIRRAVLGTLATSALFAACGFAAKQVQSLAVRSPWRDDPYDVVVSFTMFFVVLVAGLCLVRLPAFRRDQPLPLRRAADLLRAGRLAFAMIAVTLAADWASVAAGAHRAAWNAVTGGLIAGLAVLTLLTAGLAVALRRAGREVAARPRPASGPADTGPGPDWLADALSVAGDRAGRLGPLTGPARRAVGWLGDRGCPVVRDHPLGISAVIAGAFGAAVAASHAAAEGGGIGPVEWLFLAVGFCGMYAFVVAAGWYLRLVRSGRPATGWRRRLIVASVTGCASVPAALGFRGSLTWLVPGSDGGVPRLAALLVVVAGTVFALTLAATAASRPARSGRVA